MILNTYTIYDRKSLIYSPPFYAATDGAATRIFSDLVNDQNTSVGRHPTDYVLFQNGTFNDQNGQLLPFDVVSHVIDAAALVVEQQPLPFKLQEVK